MVLQTFVKANVRWSLATERRFQLPSEEVLANRFEDEANMLIRALPDGAVALDLGGGRSCLYAPAVEPAGRIKLIAVDISKEELAHNTDVTETCVADVAEGLPMPDQSVDLILSHALLEHVEGVPQAIAHMGRVLKPGGTALHYIPCRYSLFGTAARLLPFGPLVWLQRKISPWGPVGFPVHYDHCYPQALERAFRSAGFSDVHIEWTWACAGYFSPIYPLFLLHALYERTVRKLRLRKLAAYAVVRAIRLSPRFE
jgi:SAM-dependent methyltransferase